jgi:hypothetical protein
VHGRAWLSVPPERKNAEGRADHVHCPTEESSRFRFAWHSKGPVRNLAKKANQRAARAGLIHGWKSLLRFKNAITEAGQCRYGFCRERILPERVFTTERAAFHVMTKIVR